MFPRHITPFHYNCCRRSCICFYTHWSKWWNCKIHKTVFMRCKNTKNSQRVHMTCNEIQHSAFLKRRYFSPVQFVIRHFAGEVRIINFWRGPCTYRCKLCENKWFLTDRERRSNKHLWNVHGTTSQEIIVFKLTTKRTWNLTYRIHVCVPELQDLTLSCPHHYMPV